MNDQEQTTLDYYSANCEAFVSSTISVPFSSVQDRFLAYLRPGSHILDLGCGSGRDARYFQTAGYTVTAMDGCPEMCQSASERIQQTVICCTFDGFSADAAYDGIWACASLLHEPPEKLPDLFARIRAALKPDGIFYCSFKLGDFAGMRSGRWFTDMTMDRLLPMLNDFEILETWNSKDARKERTETWLNILMKKTGTQ